MFLSQLVLNPRSPLARRDLASGYQMHRTLLGGGFDGRPREAAGRLLFRVDFDRDGTGPRVLVQSAAAPDWARLPAGYLLRPAEAKPVVLAVAAGRRLRFRLRANPSKRVAGTNPRLGAVMAGRRVGLVTEADRVRWLIRKGESGGFRIPGEWVTAADPLTGEPRELPNFRIDVIPEGRDRNDKAGCAGGVFAAVRFEGVLEVTDPARFADTVQAGVGPAKTYGFGLLSVSPG